MRRTVGPFGSEVPDPVAYYTRPERKKVSRFRCLEAKRRTGRSDAHKRFYRSYNAGLSCGITTRNNMNPCSFIWLGNLCIRIGRRS